MSHDTPENEPLTVGEPEIRDNTWAHDRERIVRSEYKNGMSIEEGEVTDGEHKGHKWLRTEGGPTIEGSELGPMTLGKTSVLVDSLEFHHASIVLEQGAGAGKDPKGFNSIKAKAIVTVMPEAVHDESSLRDLSEGDEQLDDKGRPTAKVRRTPDGKVIAEKTSYLDDEGVMITTGLHREGSEQGKMYETRRAMRPEASLAVPTQKYGTPRGDIENLQLVSMTSDVRPSDQARLAEGDKPKEQQRTVWLEFQGDWTGE